MTLLTPFGHCAAPIGAWAHSLNAEAEQEHEAERGQHHHPNQGSPCDLLIEARREAGIGNYSSQSKAGGHEVVDPQHVLPQADIDRRQIGAVAGPGGSVVEGRMVRHDCLLLARS
jgi:hypothetical protein